MPWENLYSLIPHQRRNSMKLFWIKMLLWTLLRKAQWVFMVAHLPKSFLHNYSILYYFFLYNDSIFFVLKKSSIVKVALILYRGVDIQSRYGSWTFHIQGNTGTSSCSLWCGKYKRWRPLFLFTAGTAINHGYIFLRKI